MIITLLRAERGGGTIYVCVQLLFMPAWRLMHRTARDVGGALLHISARDVVIAAWIATVFIILFILYFFFVHFVFRTDEPGERTATRGAKGVLARVGGVRAAGIAQVVARPLVCGVCRYDSRSVTVCRPPSVVHIKCHVRQYIIYGYNIIITYIDTHIGIGIGISEYNIYVDAV